MQQIVDTYEGEADNPKVWAEAERLIRKYFDDIAEVEEVPLSWLK
jgi:hypothetical protein